MSERSVRRTLVSAGPEPISKELRFAIENSGSTLVPPQEAEVLVWEEHRSPGFREFLEAAPQARWVQLASAGVEWVFAEDVYSDRLIWTCAKGDVLGPNVAELALLFLLAAFRDFKRFVGATQWLEEGGRHLHGAEVTIVGGGGIARALIQLLQPFDIQPVVVRREERPVPGASRVVAQAGLLGAIGSADAVVLAAPLTSETRRMINASALAAMKPGAWLINVSRGPLVDTQAVVAALNSGRLGGVALDVTDPEPLPVGHALWSHPRAIITPHIANTEDMSKGAFAALVERNLQRWARHEPLLAVIDPQTRY
jgi:phosphoglycerate dehydrogenase-like enzyme